MAYTLHHARPAARLVSACLAVALLAACTASAFGQKSYATLIAEVQPHMVKIYGAGGFQKLESYQSGFLISANGHVLTAWSYVLDTDVITVTLNDGRKFQADLLGADPRLEIAVLKIAAEDLPHFNMNHLAELSPGDRVLAFSNLYGVATGNEPASVLHGRVMYRGTLDARSGAFETPYSGPVYVVDAMTNNPGSAGGALTDREGRLVGIIGKELRSSQNNIWLNYSIPVGELVGAVDDIMAGKVRPRSDDETIRRVAEPITLPLLGIVTLPDVLSKTPPFIERVVPGSPAAQAGLQVDDLILFVNKRVVPSCKTLRSELELIDRAEELNLTVQRGNDLLEVTLTAQR
jgi:S1-C subfamily serine protease